jgi:hypothetical protein
MVHCSRKEKNKGFSAATSQKLFVEGILYRSSSNADIVDLFCEHYYETLVIDAAELEE